MEKTFYPFIAKLFPGHNYKFLTPHCAVVLERSVGQRWCSLMHARKSGIWTGRIRQNCSRTPPRWFEKHHRAWYAYVPKHRIYLTFADITQTRNASLANVAAFCARVWKGCNLN